MLKFSFEWNCSDNLIVHCEQCLKEIWALYHIVIYTQIGVKFLKPKQLYPKLKINGRKFLAVCSIEPLILEKA